MSNLLTKTLLGVKTLAEIAAKKVEEADIATLESKAKGLIDLDKARTMFEKVFREQEVQNGAIDQLQQRVSNLESLVGRLEARVPGPPPAPPPTGGAGGWIDNPPPKR